MAYSKNTWVDGGSPPISAANLQNIEDGVYANDAALTALTASTTSGINTLNNKVISASGSSLGDILTSAGSGSPTTWAPNAPYTAQSLATNGYIKLVGGVVIQWGTYSTWSTGLVTFPVAFPTACRSVTTARNHGIVWNYGNEVYAYNKTASSCYIKISGNNGANQIGYSVNWMAIGY